MKSCVSKYTILITTGIIPFKTSLWYKNIQMTLCRVSEINGSILIFSSADSNYTASQ